MLNPPPPKKKEQFANTQNLKFHNSLCNFGRDLDSRLLCNAMGHPGWQKIPMAKVLVCLLKKKKKKNSHNSGENSRIWKKNI